jgi:hypothetical protein
MAWKPEHLRGSEAWFNPWPIKYLMPAEKWAPLYWPNAEWEIVSWPPSFPREANKPPDGAIGPWWKMLPKDQWPIAAPLGHGQLRKLPCRRTCLLASGLAVTERLPSGLLR